MKRPWPHGRPTPRRPRIPNRGETMQGTWTRGRTMLLTLLVTALCAVAALGPAGLALAQEGVHPEGGGHHGGEANLALPDLSSVSFAGGVNGHTLLLFGLVVC